MLPKTYKQCVHTAALYQSVPVRLSLSSLVTCQSVTCQSVTVYRLHLSHALFLLTCQSVTVYTCHIGHLSTVHCALTVRVRGAVSATVHIHNTAHSGPAVGPCCGAARAGTGVLCAGAHGRQYRAPRRVDSAALRTCALPTYTNVDDDLTENRGESRLVHSAAEHSAAAGMPRTPLVRICLAGRGAARACWASTVTTSLMTTGADCAVPLLPQPTFMGAPLTM